MDQDAVPEKPAAEERIREIAHQLWLEEGQPEGQAEAHWRRAEQLAANENTDKVDALDDTPERIYRVA